MYYSKNSDLKIALLLVNIIENTQCQHSQNFAAGLYHFIPWDAFMTRNPTENNFFIC